MKFAITSAILFLTAIASTALALPTLVNLSRWLLGRKCRHAAMLLGLQKGGELDHRCPNVSLHQQGQNGDQHRIDAGESIAKVKVSALDDEIPKSKSEIHMQGVVHKHLRPANMLWNNELRRVLIIDFHRSDIYRRPMKKRVGSLKRSLDQVGMSKTTL
ncbi:hypothetical protein EMCG_04769 [[Emmonsia] crescens]|uniref:Protein kinase domain-containing protein n=1 Tax=[Emmonsia] crescens TaxID=73230 RepID=A0A0G2HR48_9EURO|nr:hypothetical protein EMCG_04769 [Emmonsia crescens UAMH 3008]